MIRDIWLEIRIEFAFWLALMAEPKSRASEKWFDRVNDLIRRRSPEQIKRLNGRSFI